MPPGELCNVFLTRKFVLLPRMRNALFSELYDRYIGWKQRLVISKCVKFIFMEMFVFYPFKGTGMWP
jgi:hypothetical protein